MEPKETVNEPAVAYGTEINSLDQLDFSRLYSYADYYRWKFDERVELFRGLIHRISPTPAPVHQSVALNLTLQIGNFFKKKSCRVFPAPFDVRLHNSKKQTDDRQVTTVVQPDICIICDPQKIDSRGCLGAPDLVVEVLSPGNTTREMGIKFELYEESGVKEYWLADPETRIILVYVLRESKLVGLKPFAGNDDLTSPLFPGLVFTVRDVFE